MKVTKIELIVIDFDHVGEEGIENMITDARYPNHAINPMVLKSETVDIGDWEDNNPLNSPNLWKDEVKRLFEK